MRIGEVAEQAGVNVETLRYYERRGLLPEPVRTPGGHREYGDDVVRFVRAVKEAQTLGFTLAEIEEYMALARREPSAAGETSREQLEGKLAELDERLGLLRTMRAGVLRALDVRWRSLDESTSTAAYLARRGRDPELDPETPLHVINGESVAGTLRETSLAGVALSWDDVLHVGPLAFDPATSRRLRARFLAGHGWGDAAAIESGLERRDELLAGAGRVVIWVEHDLFDQLQLLQILAQVADETDVELVQADDFLGKLDAAALEAVWLRRRRVPPVTRRAAREAWRAVTEGRLDVDVPELPHLAAALRRFAEEREPLSRTKHQLLTLLVERPEDTARALRREPAARGGAVPRRLVVLPLPLGARAGRPRARAAPAATAARRRADVRLDVRRADARRPPASLRPVQGHLVELGLTPYLDAWELQRTLASEVQSGERPDTVILLEHPPVVTLGRRTADDEVHVPEGAEVELVETDRGGKSTFHGPGQLVCYPILDLNRHGRDVRKYCRDLEEALIRTLAAFDLEATRIEGLTGVWLERPPRKIASIGVHISRWVTTHGYALNVDLDPAPFTDWITACGLEDAAFTTMARELGRPITVDEVRPAAAAAIAEVFGLELASHERLVA